MLGVQLGTSQESQCSAASGGAGGGGGVHGSSSSGQERQSYRDQFVAPEMSVVSKLMSKVKSYAFQQSLEQNCYFVEFHY